MVNGLITFPELIERSGRTRWQINRKRATHRDLMPKPVQVGGQLWWPPETIHVVQTLCDELRRNAPKG